MKALILASLIPLSAQAATQVSCRSSPVDFKIESDASFLVPGTKLTITASGVRETILAAQVDVVESAAPPLAVVNLTTGEKDDPESSIHARLELPLVQLFGNALAVNGAGKLQITKIPPRHPPRMLTRYALRDCTGNI
jgi:hypothetical protein